MGFVIHSCDLTHTIAADRTNAVDLFNSATGAWTTAQLSVARGNLAAVSFDHLAVFAGGYLGSTLPLSCESMERAMRVFMLSVIV